jgi:hypothetical protein
MKIDLNKVLVVIGGLGIAAPDFALVAGWLAKFNVPWVAYVAQGLGAFALLCTGLSRLAPRLRPTLASLGLSTPPGEVAPGVAKEPAQPQAS